MVCFLKGVAAGILFFMLMANFTGTLDLGFISNDDWIKKIGIGAVLIVAIFSTMKGNGS